MGDGARRAQMENRFGLGQPVDTYGEPCPHIQAATQVKETVEALSHTDVIDAQSSIFWKQAIYEAVQDSKLKALTGIAEDLGYLRSYYDSSDLSLILKGKTWKASEGRNIRVGLPPYLIEAEMTEEGPMLVELINPTTGETCSFYKALRKVVYPEIEIPKNIMKNLPAYMDVIVKIRQLPPWEFVNKIEGKASNIVKFKEIRFDGNPPASVLVTNLGGKEIPIDTFDYDYGAKGRGLGGAAYLEFEIGDIDKTERFRLYSNGSSEPRFAIKYGRQFRTVKGFEYDTKRDGLRIKYDYGNMRQSSRTLRFKEPPDEIDFDTYRIPEDTRLRLEKAVDLKKTNDIGDIGEEIAAQFAKEKLKAKVFPKVEYHGPDHPIIYNGESGILEAKATTDMNYFGTQFKEAKDQVRDRLEKNSKYRNGVAVGIYLEKETGYFKLNYKIMAPDAKDTTFKRLLTLAEGASDQLPQDQAFTGEER